MRRPLWTRAWWWSDEFIGWMPFGWTRGGTYGKFFWLGPVEYCRYLASRIRRKLRGPDPWPAKPKKVLIVPIVDYHPHGSSSDWASAHSKPGDP